MRKSRFCEDQAYRGAEAQLACILVSPASHVRSQRIPDLEE
jgi:hypothetical protein